MPKDSKQQKIKRIKQNKADYLAKMRKEKDLDDLLTRMNICTDPNEKAVLFSWYVDRCRES